MHLYILIYMCKYIRIVLDKHMPGISFPDIFMYKYRHEHVYTRVDTHTYIYDHVYIT